MNRTIVWFSCGAASAVAAEIAVEQYNNVHVVYCNLLQDEHPDNRRFLKDVEEWIGQPVEIINNPDYKTVDEVFEKRRYMAGIAGAPCTVAMKKQPRFAYQTADDTHIFGFTADEKKRIERFHANNPDLECAWPLLDNELTKDDCLSRLSTAGIRIPDMYYLGFRNNNCIGCVKASSARYWNMTRISFPEVFERRARQSREYGARLVRVRGERVFLDELPEDYIPGGPLENISCGPDCNQMGFEL